MTDLSKAATISVSVGTEERFWAKVKIGTPDECWEWTASRNPGGYGSFYWDGKKHGKAHRYSYELHHGPIPPGLELDHLCRNPGCVNPDHLEAVTHRENVLRGIGVTAQLARQTHCKHGHEFTEENTYLLPNGGRNCRACHVEFGKKRLRDSGLARARYRAARDAGYSVTEARKRQYRTDPVGAKQ